MAGWKHLTREKRYQIEALYRANHGVREIAQMVGCSVRTVYRELQRGRCEQLRGSTWETYYTYSATIAQRRADTCRGRLGRPLKLLGDAALTRHLERYIARKYSPAAALREAELQGIGSVRVSANTVYRYIYRGRLQVKGMDLPVGRYRAKKQAKKYVSKKHINDMSIEHRPAVVASREEAGHWEMDTVEGKKCVGKCLLVLTERKTRYEIVLLMQKKTMSEVERCLHELHNHFGQQFSTVFKTITCDNGAEFNAAAVLGRFAPVYYCHPYSSWERGTNENQNKLVRRWCPKGKSMAKVTPSHAKEITHWMNNYPRKLLGWQRPADLFAAEMCKCGITNFFY